MKKETTKCDTCGYVWVPRVEKPKKCAKCLRWIEYKDKKNDKSVKV